LYGSEGAWTARAAGVLGRAAGLVAWFSILLPAALGFLYVRSFGVSVVFSDAWSMVRLFDRWSSGMLSLSDLYAPHNDHRMFFPKGVEVLLGVVTEYDNVIEMYFIEVCFLITLVVLLLAFRDGTRPWLVLFVPVSVLIFSLRQYENMLFGFQINFAFTQTFGVLALFLLSVFARRGSRKLPLAAALGSATVASFSTAQGLFVWPAGLLQLLIGPAEKAAKRVSAVVWGLAGLGEWVAYFVDYARPVGSESLLGVLDHPSMGAAYFLSLLGSSLFWQQSPALLGGLFIAGLAVVTLGILARDRMVGEHSFWISVLLYSLLMLAAITIGRAPRCSEPGRRWLPGTRPSPSSQWRASTRYWQRWPSRVDPASALPWPCHCAGSCCLAPPSLTRTGSRRAELQKQPGNGRLSSSLPTTPNLIGSWWRAWAPAPRS
jgi:hypothetical protein